MELTDYAMKCLEPVTEEIYDQFQFASLKVHEYMKRKHAGVHEQVIQAVCYKVFMSMLEQIHDDASTLEIRAEDGDIFEWTENAYSEVQSEA